MTDAEKALLAIDSDHVTIEPVHTWECAERHKPNCVCGADRLKFVRETIRQSLQEKIERDKG